MKHLTIPAIILAVSLSACGNSDNISRQGDATPANPPLSQTDAAAPVEQSRILVSKGTIRSANEVRIYSRIEGQLLDFSLAEGQNVRKGQTLFKLDDWDLKSKCQMSESEFEQAGLRMEEILIGQGYRRDEFDKVPEKIRNYARVKSGLKLCEEKLSYHKSKLAQTRIVSPISGIVTGITPLPYSFVKAGETLCTVVDPNHLVVEFSVLETELGKFSKGNTVEIIPIAYPDKKYSGTVSSMESVVDTNGMIKIMAVISETENLMPGMTAIVNL